MTSRNSHATAVGRRVVLVDFYWGRDKDPRVPLGHASLLAALRTDPALDVRSITHAVNVEGDDADAIVARLLTEAAGTPDASVDIAFGAYVWNEALLQRVLAGLRRAGFRGRILLGGPQISYSEAGLERRYPHADAFVRGYGELALLQVARAPGKPAVRGVQWAGQPDTAEQATVDLQSLPSPWLTGAIQLAGQRFVRWETQRGCPFRCAFCQHREAGARLARRSLNSTRIFQEIDLFCDAGVDDIAVLDPVFNAGPLAVPVLQRFRERGFGGRLSLQCRAETVDSDFLDATKNLNVQLEFGLQTIHPRESEAIHRRGNILKVDKVLEQVRRRGIRHEVSIIFGLPAQTLASFRGTVEWCLARRVPVIKAFPLLLLRGTELDRDRERWGLREDGGAMPMVIASDSFDHADWLAMARTSEALKSTEGRHPATLNELLRLAGDSRPAFARWRSDATA